jgi:2'-5' RNA ligase
LELTDSLRPAAETLRWSRPEGLHITLKFIGEISESQLSEVERRLTRMPAVPAFTISVRGSGFFPSAKRPRIIWLGVEAGEELSHLARAIDAELGRMDIPAEARAYRPHLTLARAEGTEPLNKLQDQLNRLGRIDLGTFTADEYFIYQSQPSHGGSIYTKLFRIAMNGPSHVLLRDLQTGRQ